MKTSPLRFLLPAILITFVALLVSSCVTAGYGYGGYDGYGGGYAVDYYEPYGGVYGAWGPGYVVGPYRNGGGRRGPDHGGHTYRSAPASHSMPSIPSGGGRHH